MAFRSKLQSFLIYSLLSRVFFTGFPIRAKTIHLKLSQPNSFPLLAPKGPSSPTVTCHHPTHLPATGSLSCLFSLLLVGFLNYYRQSQSKAWESRRTSPDEQDHSAVLIVHGETEKNVSFRKQCRKYLLLHMVFVKLYNVTHYMLEAISGPKR